jgi:hydrogenase maturation protease
VAEPLAPGTRFIGVGHPYRGDDGVGPWLAEALARLGFDAIAHAGDGADLIAAFEAGGAIVIADATCSGRPPGTVTTLDARAAPLPSDLFHRSTHAFGLAAAVETARALGLLPDSLTILGIEGAEFGTGPGLTSAVAAAAGELLSRLVCASAGAGPAPHRLRPDIAPR